MKHLPLLTFLLLVGGCSLLSIERPAEHDAAARLQQGLASLDAGLYAEAFDDLAWVYSSCAGYEGSYQALAGLAALELDPRNPRGRETVGSEMLGRLIQHPGPPDWSRPLSTSAYLMSRALGAGGAAASGTGESVEPGVASRESAPSGAAAADGSGTAPTADSVAGSAAAGTEPRRVAGPGGAPAGVDSVPVQDTAAEARTGGAGAARAGGDAGVRSGGRTEAPPIPEAAAEPVYGCGARVSSDDWVTPQLPTLPGPSLVAILGAAEAERDAQAARADSLAEALSRAQRQLQETRSELERIRKTLKP